MMELTPIEQEFNKIVPDWISQFKNKNMLPSYKKKLADYPCCLVGDVRYKLGLSRKYHSRWTLDKEEWVGDNKGLPNDQYCYLCGALADEFFELGEDSFDESLEDFKEHLEKDHGKKLS
jgi:hypothetical protein